MCCYRFSRQVHDYRRDSAKNTGTSAGAQAEHHERRELQKRSVFRRFLVDAHSVHAHQNVGVGTQQIISFSSDKLIELICL